MTHADPQTASNRTTMF